MSGTRTAGNIPLALSPWFRSAGLQPAGSDSPGQEQQLFPQYPKFLRFMGTGGIFSIRFPNFSFFLFSLKASQGSGMEEKEGPMPKTLISWEVFTTLLSFLFDI